NLPRVDVDMREGDIAEDLRVEPRRALVGYLGRVGDGTARRDILGGRGRHIHAIDVHDRVCDGVDADQVTVVDGGRGTYGGRELHGAVASRGQGGRTGLSVEARIRPHTRNRHGSTHGAAVDRQDPGVQRVGVLEGPRHNDLVRRADRGVVVREGEMVRGG